MPSRSRLWPDPRVKPPFGVATIDWAHPLANGLGFYVLGNEGGGLLTDSVRGTRSISAVAEASWIVAPKGLSIVSANSVRWAKRDGGQTNFTALAVLTAYQASTLQSAPGTNFVMNDDPDVIGFGWCFGYEQGTGSIGSFHLRIDSSNKNFAEGLQKAGPQTVVATVSGTAAVLFRDGGQIDTLTLPSPVTADATNRQPIVGSGTTTTYSVSSAAYWLRGLDAGRAEWLSAEPYAMFKSTVRRHYSVPAGVTVRVKEMHYRRMRA